MTSGSLSSLCEKLRTTRTREYCAETKRHIRKVGEFLDRASVEISRRSQEHDYSKLSAPELDGFASRSYKLKSAKYGTQAYKDQLEQLKPILEHHYSRNRHHPEHFEDGVNGMNLVDLIEMIADWKASSSRQGINEEDASRRLEHSIKRFRVKPQLAQILRNTWDFLN